MHRLLRSSTSSSGSRTPTRDALALANIDDDGLLDLVTCTSGELQIVLMAPGTAPRPQEIHDQFIHACALHVEPDAIRITAATATDRGYSVLRPDFAPALARTDLFPGGPSPLRRLVTGDIDADGLTNFVVSDDGSGATSSTAVFWGSPDGTPRRATWQDGMLFSRTELAVAPLDDAPGDDIVIASASNTQIWAHANSTLQLISTASRGQPGFCRPTRPTQCGTPDAPQGPWRVAEK